MSAINITLLGDSVLDDFFWLDNPKEDIRQQLLQIIPQNSVVNNFAVDESRIDCVINGIVPKTQYAEARTRYFKGEYPYPTFKNGKVYPLKLIKNIPSDYIVLSIGGNDGRVHLNKLIWGSDKVIESLKNDQFEEKLEKLVKKIIKVQKKLILVFVYKPHVTIFEQFRNQIGWGLQYLPIESVVPLGEYLNTVYDELRKTYYRIANKYNLPLIDLSRTLDPNNAKHYGTTPIEPSNLSGKTIAKLIKYTIDSHEFTNSICYFARDCNNIIQCQSIPNNI
jgi:hypothetical protein